MSSTFALLIDEIKNLPFEDKTEIKFLLDRYLIEERRDTIYENYQHSLQELEDEQLTFSDDIDELKKLMVE